MAGQKNVSKRLSEAVSSFLRRSLQRDRAARLSLVAFAAAGLVIGGNAFSSDHLPPLQNIRSSLFFWAMASGFLLLSAVLGFIAASRANNSGIGEKPRKYWVLAGFHSLFWVLSLVGLSVGGFFYLKFQRVEQQQAEQEAASVRAKYGEGDAYDLEMARRISGNFQGKLGELKRMYDLTGTAMRSPSVLDMSGVTNAEDVRYRGEIIRDFMLTAEELRSFIKNSAAIFEGEVNRHLISESARAEILTGFSERNAKINPLIVEIRGAELRKCREMENLVAFLEQAWGEWTCDTASGELTFKNDSQAKDYMRRAAKIEAADSRMTDLQKKLELIRQSIK